MAIRIVQGENKTFTIKLRDQDGDPFDLTNFDQYKVCLPLLSSHLEITEVANANGSVVALSGSPLLGKLEVTVKSTDTATLVVGDRQSIGLILNNSVTPNPRSKNFEKVLNVEASPC